MATINHSSGADIIVPSNNGTTYRGLGGDDTYILSNSIAANAAITIVDTSGANKIQLVNGLSVASTKFAADAVQLTLSNGAVVTINGASNFDFDLGGNATAGTSGSVTDFAGFAAGAGVSALPSSGSVAGASNVSVQGTAWSGGTGGSYTVTKSASSVSEGSSVTFTITASSAVSADTTFSWTVIGDTNGSTVDAAGTSDIDVLSGTATIAAGASSTTFDVTASSDSVVEGIEGIKVSVFDASSNALSSDTILVNNTGSAATSQSFTMTAGVNEFVGGSGNDNFDASTTANSLNDFDNIDGGDGVDTVTSKTTTSTNGGESLSPQMANIEVLSITNTDSDDGADTFTVNLAEATAINKVMNVTSNDDVTFDNLSNMTALEVKSAAGTTTLNYDYLTLAGASDNQEITIKGTNSTTIVLDDDNPLNSSVIETVTVNSQAVANTLAALTTTNVNATSLVVNGDKKLTITAALDADIATIDASGSTGGIVLEPGAAVATVTGSGGADSITANAGVISFSGGAGNDTLTAGATWAGTDVFDGGAGHDTLVVGANFVPTNSGPTSGSTILAGLSNVEEIKMDLDGGVVTLDKAIDGLTTIDLTNTNDQVLNLNDGFTGALTVQITDSNSASDDKIVNTANAELTVTANTGDIDGDNVTTITGGSGTDTLVLNNAVDGATITLADPDGDQDRITGVDQINIIDVTSGADVTLVTNDYTNLSAGLPAPVGIDASSLDSGEVFTLTGTASATAMNVTSGAGDDGLTGGTLSDTIDGGAGNDTLAGTNGNNVLIGGDGNDSITIGDGADNVSGGAGNDTIVAGTDLKLTDTIDGGDGVDTLTIGGDISSYTQFGGVSNIEVIAPAGAHDITANGALGDATTFSLANGGQNLLTLSAGWTADTTVLITGDATNNDSITNSANVSLTVKGNADDFDTDTTITGGTGSDELLVTADAGTATLANVTNVEKVTIVDAVTAGTGVTVVPNLTTTKAQSIDGSELDGSTQNDEVLTVSGDGAAGTLDILGGGGQDALTGGTKNDTIDGAGGQDAIDGKGGADHISGGAANDTITIGSKTEFTSTVGTDTIDGGAGVDTITWTGAMNMEAASLSTISNTEIWSIAAGSDFTISDAVLTNNPGVTFVFAGAGTLSGGEDTAGAALMTEAISFTATGGDYAMKLIGSSGDDVYTFDATGTLTAADTIDGNAGTDTIQLENNTSATDSTGNAVTAVIGANAKGLEKIVVLDQADADYAGNATLTIDSGYTDTALTIDASALDTDPTNGAVGEVFTLTNNDDVAVTVTSGDARDVITDGAGAANIDTGNGNDSITSGGGNDTIKAGAGIDTINSGAGTDNIDAGAGNDVINVTTWSDFKTSGGVVTIEGGAGTDTIRFDESANNALVLTAPEVSEISGVEVILLDSGTATSAITLGNAAMESNGGVFNITTNDGAGATTVDASAVSNGVINVTSDNGNASNDVLYGGSGDDTFTFGLNGLADGDTINGFGGSDTIILNAADGGNVTAVIDFTDTKNIEKVSTKVAAATGLDTHTITLNIVTATPAALNAGALEVDFSGLTNPAVGGATFNGTTVTDSKVDFTITGSSKSDTLTGSAGHDNISAGGVLVADSITGGSGNDTLSGASGNDTLKGGTGNDNITGNAGADSVDGGAGNDVISGGDGADTIDGEGGADTITLGAGKDILEYDAAADSTGSTKDNITDFTQSTINAVTTDTVTAGDSVNINFGTLDNTANTFTLSDKGDVANAGLAGAAIDGVQGSFVFAVDSSTVYLDFNGDGLLNASDLQITFDGLETFHSNDINAIVTAGTGGDTLTGGNGDDSLTGGSGDDSITGGYGADVIVSADGADVVSGGGGADTITDAAGAATITGGAGNDTITGGTGIDSITAGTGDDLIDLSGVLVVANGDKITDFEDAGAVVGDVIKLEADDTSDATAAGSAPVITTISTAAVADGEAYALGDTDTADIFELTVNDGSGDLSASTTGTELVKTLAGTGTDAAAITGKASTNFYILAYDTGAGGENEAYLYYVANDNNTAILAAEILLVATFEDGVAAGAFVAEDFILG